MKRFLAILLLAAALSLVALWRTDGFTPDKIQGRLQDGRAEPIAAEILPLLREQRYSYLGKGRQCFAFVSEDGETVIKFLNYRRFSLPKWLLALPKPSIWQERLEKWAMKRQSRFAATLDSFSLAHRSLSEETGLLYVHLQPGEGLPVLSIIDPAHRVHAIDLNRVVFLLQARAVPIYEELNNRWRESGQEGLEEGIGAFLQFLEKRCSLGIADDDRDVEINFGFRKGVPLLVDPGRLFLDPKLQTREGIDEELSVATRRLRIWLEKSHPAALPFFDGKIASLKEKLADAAETSREREPIPSPTRPVPRISGSLPLRFPFFSLQPAS